MNDAAKEGCRLVGAKAELAEELLQPETLSVLRPAQSAGPRVKAVVEATAPLLHLPLPSVRNQNGRPVEARNDDKS